MLSTHWVVKTRAETGCYTGSRVGVRRGPAHPAQEADRAPPLPDSRQAQREREALRAAAGQESGPRAH